MADLAAKALGDRLERAVRARQDERTARGQLAELGRLVGHAPHGVAEPRIRQPARQVKQRLLPVVERRTDGQLACATQAEPVADEAEVAFGRQRGGDEKCCRSALP